MTLQHVNRGLWVLLGALGLTTACTEDLLGPLDGRTFVLQTVSGSALPAVFDSVLSEEYTQTWTVFADTIWLVSNKWGRHIVYEERFSDGQVLQRDFEYGGVVRRRDGELLLVFGDGGAQCDCIAPDRVEEEGNGLVMGETLFHGGTDLSFAPL